MRIIAVVLAALLASVAAFPPQVNDKQSEITARDERLITDSIAAAISLISRLIREAGLDPLDIPYMGEKYSFPVAGILEAQAYVQDVRSTGLSNIVINRLNWAVLTSRLTFDIEMPRIDASVGDALAEVLIFNDIDLSARSSGSLAINRLRITGGFRVNIGIISGISIQNLNLDFSMGGIDSNLSVVVLGRDFSSELNTFLGTSLPASLENNRAAINELLELILMQLVDELL